MKPVSSDRRPIHHSPMATRFSFTPLEAQHGKMTKVVIIDQQANFYGDIIIAVGSRIGNLWAPTRSAAVRKARTKLAAWSLWGFLMTKHAEVSEIGT
jgi:hypothetical protein